MNIRFPRWSVWCLLLLLGATGAAGLLLERRVWATEHPYLVNVLSALTIFAASALFAAVVPLRKHSTDNTADSTETVTV